VRLKKSLQQSFRGGKKHIRTNAESQTFSTEQSSEATLPPCFLEISPAQLAAFAGHPTSAPGVGAACVRRAGGGKPSHSRLCRRSIRHWAVFQLRASTAHHLASHSPSVQVRLNS